MTAEIQGALFGADVPYKPPASPPRPRTLAAPVEPATVHHEGQLAAPVVPVKCEECGRMLRTPGSIAAGIGPVCRRQRRAAQLAGDDPADTGSAPVIVGGRALFAVDAVVTGGVL